MKKFFNEKAKPFFKKMKNPSPDAKRKIVQGGGFALATLILGGAVISSGAGIIAATVCTSLFAGTAIVSYTVTKKFASAAMNRRTKKTLHEGLQKLSKEWQEEKAAEAKKSSKTPAPKAS